MKKIMFFVQLLLSTVAVADAKMPFALSQKHPTVGTFNSADYPDHIFVIEAYFNGCGYCRQNSTNVNALSTRYAGRKIVILDVSVDNSESEYRSWIRGTRPNHPVLDDHRRTLLWGDLGARGFPSTYVIDFSGKVLWTHTGVWEGLDEISEVIDQAIHKQNEEVQ